MSNNYQERHADGTFAHTQGSFEAVYTEIRRLDQLRSSDNERLRELRTSDQASSSAALLATREAAGLALDASKEAIIKAEAAQLRYDTGPPSLDTLQHDISKSEGRNQGTGDTWKIVTMVLTAVLGVAGLILAVAVAVMK